MENFLIRCRKAGLTHIFIKACQLSALIRQEKNVIDKKNKTWKLLVRSLLSVFETIKKKKKKKKKTVGRNEKEAFFCRLLVQGELI